MQSTSETDTSPRSAPDARTGLTQADADQRLRAGQDNRSSAARSKSVGRILRDNLCTLFNLVNVILAVAILLVGSYKNVLFLGVVLCNTVIGAVQEIRAKRTVDRLSLISSCKAQVVRDGQVQSVPMEQVVLDDVVVLSRGSQVVADAVVLEGACDVNESFVTGEPDAIRKEPGDPLLAGSFVVSGACRAHTQRVGDGNYIATISRGVKVLKGASSEIMRTLRKIIRLISVLIFPVGGILLYNQLTIAQSTVSQGVVHTAGALIGMIPSGLMLLTSSVLAVGVIRLSQNRVLVQDLYCIEALARVDTLCLDKTGTLTEGRMELSQVIPLPGHGIEEAARALAALAGSLEDRNATLEALAAAFPGPPGWTAAETVPFNSQTKWSGCCFEEQGSYALGAAEYLLPDRLPDLQNALDAYSGDYRTLLLAHTPAPLAGSRPPAGLEPVALVLLQDRIRPEAAETLRYFAQQGVAIKVISGDGARTVAGIAKRTGIAGWERWIDATALETPEQLAEAAADYTVFGRVTPAQKQELVRALKAQGHTVAMTGDGVNDVLALKEADCSVAMAEGSDAARNVAQLVLLDSGFDAMPHVVAEGRRSINNIQRSASLYLVKTIYSTFLAILFVFLQYPYPFAPIQLTLVSVLTIGAPSFILALEPNHERIRGSFFRNVLLNALPGAATIILEIILTVIASALLRLPLETYSTLCVLATGYSGLLLLAHVCRPFDRIRGALFLTMAAGFVLAVLLLPGLFSLAPLSWTGLLTLAGLLFCATGIFSLLCRLMRRQTGR